MTNGTNSCVAVWFIRTAVRRCGDTDNNCYKWALEGGCENSSATWQFVFHNMEFLECQKNRNPQNWQSQKKTWESTMGVWATRSLGRTIFTSLIIDHCAQWSLNTQEAGWSAKEPTFVYLNWWTWISYRNFQPGGPNKRSSRWDFLPTLLMPSSGLGSHRSQDSIEIYCPLSCGSCEPHSCSAQEANEADVGGGWRRSEETLLSTWPWRHAMPK